MLSSSALIWPLLVYQVGYEQAPRDPTPPLIPGLPWAAHREVCAGFLHPRIQSSELFTQPQEGSGAVRGKDQRADDE
jgi:hypothetical protein